MLICRFPLFSGYFDVYLDNFRLKKFSLVFESRRRFDESEIVMEERGGRKKEEDAKNVSWHATLLKLVFIKISMHKSRDSGATLCQIRPQDFKFRSPFKSATHSYSLQLLLTTKGPPPSLG